MAAGTNSSGMRADGHRQEREARAAAEIPGRAAEHGNDQAFAVADGEHRRRHARDVGGRAQQRRQREADREHEGAEEAEHAREHHRPDVRGGGDAGEAQQHQRAAQMSGQARRSSLPAIASSANDAGSWPKLSAVSAPAIRSGRPAPAR